MRADTHLLAASALVIAMCRSTGAAAVEPSPGNRAEAEAAVVQVLGDSASGTGFVYDAGRGLVVTTAYITAGQSGLNVLVAGKPMVPAQLLGSDLCQDLAVLKLAAPQEGLKEVPFGDSDLVAEGDAVTSLGYPTAGQAGAAVVAAAGEAKGTVGEVSHLSSPDYPSVIYHSVATKGGDVGGPVLNSEGEVVGVNTGAWVEADPLIGEDSRVSEAISSNHATSQLPGLAAGAKKNDPGWWLGAVTDPGLPEQAASAELDQGSLRDVQKRLKDEGIEGLFVFGVRKDSPADRAKLQQGAVLTTVDGQSVSSYPELCEVLEPASPGDKLNLEGVYSGVGAAGHTLGESWTAELVPAGTTTAR